MTNNQSAVFHSDQWESINELVEKQNQLLVVQRTGWGKSAVYFIATKLRRMQGFGPSIIISPLLSLIRNQIDSAAKLGLNVVSYNSSMTRDERAAAEQEIVEQRVDAVIITPEQLGNDYFNENVLSQIISNIGLFVVDEAHCISDWGHDFRPDYQRIVRVLQNMPSNIPVLATTATANNRVVEDVEGQLGDRLSIIRGPLTRSALQLQNLFLSTKAERLAWLAENINSLDGTGIIYAKTTRDCELVVDFLQSFDINVKAYHSRLEPVGLKLELEQDLVNNRIKALVATSSLGMGFDKPDIGFVIHFQSPGNIVEYYQQVGRAGRGIEHAVGILMLGAEDERIQRYFIENAFPKEKQIAQLLAVVESNDGIKITDMEPGVNFSSGKIKDILKFLSVETPSPILKDGACYYRTQYDYSLPTEKIERLNMIKNDEWNTLQDYHQSSRCLMHYLATELDDDYAEQCGKCVNCQPKHKLSEEVSNEMVFSASDFMRHRYVKFKPRKTFASSGNNARSIYENYNFPYKASNLCVETGYALSAWRDGGWGDLVASGKANNHFCDDLLDPMVKMIESLSYDERPGWIAYIPSPRHPILVKDFANRLAFRLNVPCMDSVIITEERPPQKTMENSYFQSKNLDGAFGIVQENIYSNPVWLIDDAIDSGWTYTIVGALLKRAGAGKVFPIALTSTKRSS